jgi:hypothetical protein
MPSYDIGGVEAAEPSIGVCFQASEGSVLGFRTAAAAAASASALVLLRNHRFWDWRTKSRIMGLLESVGLLLRRGGQSATVSERSRTKDRSYG